MGGDLKIIDGAEYDRLHGGTGRAEGEPEPFPTHLLPEIAARMAREIARVTGTPEALTAPCVLGILSAAVGAGAEAETAPNLITRANLYLVGGAETGTGKSRAFDLAAEPFYRIEQELLEAWETDREGDLLADLAEAEADLKAGKNAMARAADSIARGEAREEVKAAELRIREAERNLQRAPRLIVGEITPEALAERISGQVNESLASLSADAREVVEILLGRYSKSGETSEAIYLSAFSGEPVKVDRKGGGRGSSSPTTIRLARPCLSALWLIQPDKVNRILGNRSLTEGGLVPRLLLFQSGAEPVEEEENPRGIDQGTREAWANLVGAITQKFRLAEEIENLPVSAGAAEIFRTYNNETVRRRKKGGDLRDVTGYAARWPEQARRIAVLLGAVEGAGIKSEIAEAAVGIAKWFAGQQLEILAKGREGAKAEEERKLWDRVAKIAGENGGEITPRIASQRHLARTTEEAEEILNRFAGKRRLLGPKITQPDSGGHPTKTYRLP